MAILVHHLIGVGGLDGRVDSHAHVRHRRQQAGYGRDQGNGDERQRHDDLREGKKGLGGDGGGGESERERESDLLTTIETRMQVNKKWVPP